MAAGITPPHTPPGCYSPQARRNDLFPTDVYLTILPSQVPLSEVWEQDLRREAKTDMSAIRVEFHKLMERLAARGGKLNDKEFLIIRVHDAFCHFLEWRIQINPVEVAFHSFYSRGIPESFHDRYMTILTANLLYDHLVSGIPQYELLAGEIDKLARKNCSTQILREEAYELFRKSEMDGASACSLVIKDCMVKNRPYEAIHFVSNLTKRNLKIAAANYLAFFLTQQYSWGLEQVREMGDQVVKDHLIYFCCKRLFQRSELKSLIEFSQCGLSEITIYTEIQRYINHLNPPLHSSFN